MTDKVINVGIIGLGTVGGGLAQLLMEKQEQLSEYLGARLNLAKVADLMPEKAAELGIAPEKFTTDAWEIINSPDIHIVAELIGGLEPARTMTLEALKQGKQVATANKALLAIHGEEIFRAARQNKCAVAFEASVGGGIPIIKPLRQGLAANHFSKVLGILNGTCNYILSRMACCGASYDEVLAEAQSLGYAEADPTMDVEGKDPAHKLAIIAGLLTGKQPRFQDISIQGITGITPQDIRYADEFGYVIKLLAILDQSGGPVEARVHPALLPKDHVLAKVDGPFNALFMHGDWVDDILLYGPGAGRRPTASALVGDMLELSRDILAGTPGRMPPLGSDAAGKAHLELTPISRVRGKYYLRFSALDQPGVLASISRALGDQGISIDTMSQKGRKRQGPVAIVMLTHDTTEAQITKALSIIDEMPVVAKKTMYIRVVDK